ncbi:hypothetical protein [Neobacillus vireti]|uniref:hypothetical protein n=1 Tax=Neobacillus vireti TaxID=220686 RepID=UPI002FFF8BB7
MEKMVVTGYGVKGPKSNNIEQFLYNLANEVNCLEVISNLSHKGEESHALQRSIPILGEIENVISKIDGVYLYSLDEAGDQMVNACPYIKRYQLSGEKH